MFGSVLLWCRNSAHQDFPGLALAPGPLRSVVGGVLREGRGYATTLAE